MEPGLLGLVGRERLPRLVCLVLAPDQHEQTRAPRTHLGRGRSAEGFDEPVDDVERARQIAHLLKGVGERELRHRVLRCKGRCPTERVDRQFHAIGVQPRVADRQPQVGLRRERGRAGEGIARAVDVARPQARLS